MTPSVPHIVSIQTGAVSPLLIHDSGEMRRVMSGIRKTPVSTLTQPTPVPLGRMGLHGDEQEDLTVHGGLDKAVYAYPVEHYAYWQDFARREAPSLALPLPHGLMGENLTVSGLDEDQVWIGDVWQIGDCRLRVELPRRPCYKFNAVMRSARAARTMMVAGCTGWYLSVQQTGTLCAGDVLTIQPGPRQLTVRQRQREMTRRVDLQD